MKHLIVVLALALVTSTSIAGGRHDNRNNYRHDYRPNSNHWVAPMIVGGIIGWSLSAQDRQRPEQCERIIILDRYGRYLREERRCY